jgi:hypothetical protein
MQIKLISQMKKLSIKSIIEFSRKSDKSKMNFATAVKIDKAKVDTEGGGDYWISCLSAISNSFKTNNLESIIDKRCELEEKYGETEFKKTKTMYKRNIDILYNYEDFDLKKWKPSKKIKLLKKHKDDSILTIKGLQVQVIPHHVFTFQKNDVEEIGAIWFIAKLDGYRKDELGMFADILYRYLRTHFSKDYILNSKYCIAVDVFNNFEVSYSQLEKREMPLTLNSTLDEIKKLL